MSFEQQACNDDTEAVLTYAGVPAKVGRQQ